MSRKHPHAQIQDTRVRKVVKQLVDMASRGSLRRDDVFQGLLDCMFWSLYGQSRQSAGFDKDEAEDRYMKTVERVGKDKVRAFPELFAELHTAMQERPRDVLGEVWSALDCGNDAAGQFFTPYQVSWFMAQATLTSESLKSTIDEKGYITLREPSVGAGGMLVAAAETMREADFEPATSCLAVATDIDFRCVQMAFVQSTMIGLPCIVEHANALKMEDDPPTYYNVHAWPMVAYINGVAKKPELASDTRSAEPEPQSASQAESQETSISESRELVPGMGGSGS